MSHRFPVVSALLPIALLPLALLPLALLSLLIWVGSSVPAVAQALPSGAGVDLNTADAATLARELQGIGESRARAIVEHRRRHGPFRSVDELALVRGIGPKTVERNRSRLRIGAVAAPAGDGRGGVSVSRPPVGLPSRPQEQGPIIMEGLPREAV